VEQESKHQYATKIYKLTIKEEEKERKRKRERERERKKVRNIIINFDISI